MTTDDRRPSQDSELRRLQDLARRGTDELGALEPDRAARLWDAVADEALDAGPATSPPDAPDGVAARAVRWLPLSLAAGVALLVGVGIGAVVVDGDGGELPATLATVELDALEDGVVPHTATLREGDDGRTVHLDLADLPPPDGFHEVWLLDPEDGGLVSLGPARPDGVYAVPPGVDLVELSTIDVSTEPQDGDPTHSGRSVLRGEVRWTG